MTSDTATPPVIEHRIGPTGRFAAKVADWELRLVAGSDDVVRIRDTDGGSLPDDLEIDRGTGSLSIRQQSRFPGVTFVLGSPAGSRRLTIDVPARAAITVGTASGDVVATGLRGEQQFRTASGDLELAAASGDVAVETVSGDVAIRVDDSITLSLKTVSGDASVEGGRVERLRLTTTSGDIQLASDLGPGPHAIATVSGDAALRSNRGLRITALTVAGDLRSDLPHTSQGGPGRRSLVVGDGMVEVQFRSVSGDLRVLDPLAPTPPTPPIAPRPPTVHDAEAASSDDPDETEAARLEILRALEIGEIDVTEAASRLAGLDGATDD